MRIRASQRNKDDFISWQDWNVGGARLTASVEEDIGEGKLWIEQSEHRHVCFGCQWTI